jgi:hypothetical protein
VFLGCCIFFVLLGGKFGLFFRDITEFKSLKGQEAFSSLKTAQTVFGAYPAYYSVVPGLFPWDKAAGL